MSEGTKKNVLLLCLSMTKVNNGKDGLYSYVLSEEKEGVVEGYLTNEAPAKSIIEKLHAKKPRERLDEIIIICSDSVRKEVINDDNRNIVDQLYMERRGKVLEKDNDGFEKLTHIQLYESLIQRFAMELSDDDINYIKIPIKFHEIPVSDDTNGTEVAMAAVEAAEFLKKEGNTEINLYIDYNGGQRYMAFMLVSIANLAKVRGVQIKEILTMNYEKKQDDVVPIQNMMDVFGCVDLVSGVNEYINYGRTKMLESYFANAPAASDGTNKIKDILNDMREFSYAMQMCNIKDVREKGKKLKDSLENYESNQKNTNTYEVLFSYVVTDIKNGYSILLESNDWEENLPEIIKWCVERDYIQQALTFYAEQMPAYFYNEHKCKDGDKLIYVFAPTEGEKKEYEKFRSEGKSNKSKVHETYNKYYKNYDEKYSWLISFLNNSHNYKNLVSESGQMKYINQELKAEKVKYCEGNKKLFDQNSIDWFNKNANILIGALHTENKRARTVLYENQLKRVLVDYFQAKELRNIFNHAAEKRSDKIQYTAICDFVKEAMEYLRESIDQAVNKELEKEKK